MATTAAAGAPAQGPLRAHPENPRYFTDGTGRAVLLVGSHTWNNLQDMGPTDPPPAFDWGAYLGFLERHHHNFVRLWRWELVLSNTEANGQPAIHNAAPHPWARPGWEYLVYRPEAGKELTVTLEPGRYHQEWIDPVAGASTDAGALAAGGGPQTLKAPAGGDVVLYLRAERGEGER